MVIVCTENSQTEDLDKGWTRLTDWCSDGSRSTSIFRSTMVINWVEYSSSPGLLRIFKTTLVATVSPWCVITSVLPVTVLFVGTLRKYCKAFVVQMRIQCDSYVSLVDTRPPTALQTALKPRAPEPLRMPCIIHAPLTASAQIHIFQWAHEKFCPATQCLTWSLI